MNETFSGIKLIQKSCTAKKKQAEQAKKPVVS